MQIKLNTLQELEEGADIEICQWFVSDGHAVKKGERIAEVLIGKSSVEIEAPADGTLKIISEENEIVSGEDIIAEIQ